MFKKIQDNQQLGYRKSYFLGNIFVVQAKLRYNELYLKCQTSYVHNYEDNKLLESYPLVMIHLYPTTSASC